MVFPILNEDEAKQIKNINSFFYDFSQTFEFKINSEENKNLISEIKFKNLITVKTMKNKLGSSMMILKKSQFIQTN